MNNLDPIQALAESAARTHLRAREGLNLPGDQRVEMLNPWRAVARRFLDMDDGSFDVGSLTGMAMGIWAAVAELSLRDPLLDESTIPAWEASCRHLCQWVNELAEGNLNGMEASEEAWRDWAKIKGLSVLEKS